MMAVDDPFLTSHFSCFVARSVALVFDESSLQHLGPPVQGGGLILETRHDSEEIVGDHQDEKTEQYHQRDEPMVCRWDAVVALVFIGASRFQEILESETRSAEHRSDGDGKNEQSPMPRNRADQLP